MNIDYHYEHRHNSHVSWTTCHNSMESILLIPKNSSSYIRRSLPLIPQQIGTSAKLFIPVRDPSLRFVSGFVEFISRTKLQDDPGRGNIFLKAEDYAKLSNAILNNDDITITILNFLKLTKEYGFLDPHVYPQSYFLKPFKALDIQIEFLDANSSIYLQNMINRFGPKNTSPRDRYSIHNKSKINLQYIFNGVVSRCIAGPIARTHLFSGENGIYREYGSFLNKKTALRRYYNAVKLAVEESSKIREELGILYEDDYDIWNTKVLSKLS